MACLQNGVLRACALTRLICHGQVDFTNTLDECIELRLGVLGPFGTFFHVSLEIRHGFEEAFLSHASILQTHENGLNLPVIKRLLVSQRKHNRL
jgi:hypothetical protein